jgi:glycerate 2-kinase
MARAAYPATTVNLMLSDVVGDKMDVIGSGPFVPDLSTYGDVRRIFEKYDLREIPAAIDAHIRAGLEGRIPETPKPGEPVFDRVHNFVVGSNILALRAAEERAKALGYGTLILSSSIEGETREVARVHAAIAKEIVATGRPIPAPACIITGGETTVTVRGSGPRRAKPGVLPRGRGRPDRASSPGRGPERRNRRKRRSHGCGGRSRRSAYR